MRSRAHSSRTWASRPICVELDALQTVEEVLGPPPHGVALDAALHRLVALPLLVFGHLERRADRLDHRVAVERVDHDGLSEFARRACHLGENEHAGLVEPACDVLLGDQVHAVAQRGHERDVGGGVRARELLELERAVVVADRRPVHGRVLAVDRADELVDLALELPVLVDSLAGGDRHGDHDDALCATRGSARGSRRTLAGAPGCPWCSRAGRCRG